MVASVESSTPVAYRIAHHRLHDGSVLYSIRLIYADGTEMSVGRMLRTEKGVRNQKGITLPATEVLA